MYRPPFPPFFFLLFILCLFSCKKEKDDLEPSVTFIIPNENQSFKVNDNILVQATVRDDKHLSSLSISLLDANQSAAHISVTVPVSSPSMTISAYYPLNNIHLESGLYHLEISAPDGVNVSHTYRTIYINALPRVLRNVYVVTNASANQVNLSYIDSTFNNIIPYHNFASDYIGSSISSYYQQAYVCGNYTGSFTGIKLLDKSQKFTISPIVSSEPYFTGFYNDDRNNYVARYDGFMKGYDYMGNVIFVAEADIGFYPQHMFLNNNYFIAEQQNKTSGIKKLITYLYTGTPK
ncbi:MAG: hypothetical protein H0W84_12210, partial [Bacteroidetes bacterium]|nr:hypothetical protein [Bacteroidota bacterium]